MLLNRYNNIEFVLSLDVEDGVDLITKAIEQKQEDYLMQRWITHYQHEVSFNEFKEKLNITNTPADARTKDEILDEIEEIRKLFNKAAD